MYTMYTFNMYWLSFSLNELQTPKPELQSSITDSVALFINGFGHHRETLII